MHHLHSVLDTEGPFHAQRLNDLSPRLRIAIGNLGTDAARVEEAFELVRRALDGVYPDS